MRSEDLISIQQLSTHYNIEFSFIDLLNEFDLIEIITIEENRFVHKEQIKDLERVMRLHYDLKINLEGIDVITHLLQRIDNLEEELALLKNKLQLDEEE